METNGMRYLVDLQKVLYKLDAENVLDSIVGGQVPPRLVDVQRHAIRDTHRLPLFSRHLGSRLRGVTAFHRERKAVSDANYARRQDA